MRNSRTSHLSGTAIRKRETQRIDTQFRYAARNTAIRRIRNRNAAPIRETQSDTQTGCRYADTQITIRSQRRTLNGQTACSPSSGELLLWDLEYYLTNWSSGFRRKGMKRRNAGYADTQMQKRRNADTRNAKRRYANAKRRYANAGSETQKRRYAKRRYANADTQMCAYPGRQGQVCLQPSPQGYH